MRMLDLTAGAMRVTLVPELGGSIAAARHASHDVFRPLSAEGRAAGDILDVGCFPMVPYANRIFDNAFTFEGRRHAFTPNLPGEPWNEHGSGWHSPWRIVAQEADAATMALDYRDPDNPYRYDATQRVGVTDDGFAIAMEVVNRGARTMPFGFGLHPWFLRDADVRVDFAARTWWPCGRDEVLARTAPPPDRAFAGGAPLPDSYVNDCYGDWGGEFVLSYPARGFAVAVRADPPLTHLMLYADPLLPVFCVEPQTNATGAFNHLDGPRQELGPILLAPGERTGGTVEFRVRAL